jgi:short subunit dehydrogenase-like uncharacterized protein
MSLLVYGANGYSGELIVGTLAEAGLRPILAGRRAEAIAPIAQRLGGLEHRAFELENPELIDRGLAGVTVVLNCAGPFSRTAVPMVEACLRVRAHYLDITGEVMVFAAVAALDAQARAAGVMLLPGAGYDVVPSDCLAAHLHQRLPSATRLRLAFRPSGGLSKGTALTSLEGATAGGLIRRGGAITKVPAGHQTITVDLGRGPTKAIAIPWGDVYTAHVTTGIPDVEVYMSARARTRVAIRAMGLFGPVLALPAVQKLLRKRLNAQPGGPSADTRRTKQMLLWGEASDGPGGRVAVSRMRTPNGYELTRLTAADLAGRALAGDVHPGYQTPAGAYGAEYILKFPGVTREDVV